MRITTTVQIDHDVLQKLRDISHSKKISVSEYVRKAIALYMQFDYEKPALYIDDNCD